MTTTEHVITALSRLQINNFFQQNDSVTQEECDAMAQELTGQAVTPTGSQGATSYTVEGGDLAVQFRAPMSALDMDFLQTIEKAYAGFVPHHEYRGQLGQLEVYLQELREELPDRFLSKLDKLLPQVPDSFTKDWPLVPNHTDLLENNIRDVDTATGRILGICDWRGAEVSPFGISLWGLEAMVGIPAQGGWWKYHPNYQELRDSFWTTFYPHLGDVSDAQKRRIEVARSIGLFMYSGINYDYPPPDDSYQLGGFVG